LTQLHVIVGISFPSISDTKNHSKKDDAYRIMVKCLYHAYVCNYKFNVHYICICLYQVNESVW